MPFRVFRNGTESVPYRTRPQKCYPGLNHAVFRSDLGATLGSGHIDISLAASDNCLRLDFIQTGQGVATPALPAPPIQMTAESEESNGSVERYELFDVDAGQRV